MNERNISKSAFRWIFFLFILLVFVIFLSARLLGARKTEQEKQVAKPTLEKEEVTQEAEEPKEVVKEISGGKTDDEPKPKVKDSPQSQQKPFTIQVASFQDKARAEIVEGELKKKGHTPTVSSVDLGEKGVWHRIFVGDFDSEEEASELLNILKEKYKDSFIKFR